MSEFAKRIVEAATGRTLEPQNGPAPKSAGTTIRPSRLANVTDEILAREYAAVPEAKPTKAELADLRAIQGRYDGAIRFITEHGGVEQSKRLFLEQADGIIAELVAGATPEPRMYFSRAVFEAGCEAAITAAKIAARKICAEALPIEKAIFQRFADAQAKRISTMAKSETARAAAIGITYHPSAELLCAEAALESANRFAVQDVGASPRHALRNLVSI